MTWKRQSTQNRSRGIELAQKLPAIDSCRKSHISAVSSPNSEEDGRSASSTKENLLVHGTLLDGLLTGILGPNYAIIALCDYGIPESLARVAAESEKA
jgi:hypothetical protein